MNTDPNVRVHYRTVDGVVYVDGAPDGRPVVDEDDFTSHPPAGWADRLVASIVRRTRSGGDRTVIVYVEAINREHAVSVAAHRLTEIGLGDSTIVDVAHCDASATPIEADYAVTVLLDEEDPPT